MKKIVLASNNQGKIREFNRIFAALDIKIISQAELNVPECDEPYATFLENSLHKARHCANYTDLPVLADDSGLCVNALNGAPGVYSARYAGEPKSDLANNKKLLKEMFNHRDRSAYFYCLLILIRHKEDPQPIVCEGFLHGEIAYEMRGENGFGYNPLMLIKKHDKHMAELSNEQISQINHRGQAVKELINKLQKLGL